MSDTTTIEPPEPEPQAGTETNEEAASEEANLNEPVGEEAGEEEEAEAGDPSLHHSAGGNRPLP